MKNSLEKLKFNIINDLANVNSILYFNDDIEKEFKPLVEKPFRISFVSDNIDSRCIFRKSFKKYNISNVYKNYISNKNNDTVILSNKMLNKYFDKISISEIYETIIISFDKITENDLNLINNFKNSFRNLYCFNIYEVDDCYVASCNYDDISLNSTAIIIASQSNINLKNFYAASTNVVLNNAENVETRELEIFDSEKYWISYLNSEIKRTQKSSYLILGPLIVAKRLMFTWLKRIPLSRKVYKIIKTYKEGGIRLVKERISNKKKENLINNKQDYSFLFKNKNEYVDFDSIYQENMDFSNKSTDIKMLAFYLPQFHTFKENDEWWGKGFTEWTNTRASKPLFKGHYQPRVPHNDIGYYDLSEIETLNKQVRLAKQHGIYGFCFYYYWFSGKRLMEKPVDLLLQHKEIDIPFCMCWANENWTRAWDGMSKNVLIKQNYSQDDDKKFILDLKKYIDDERYIKIGGKPLIIVYNPGQIPNCEKSFSTWRNVARECGIGEIIIWTCRTANNSAKSLEIEDYIDAEVEFPPHNTWLNDFAVENIDLKGKSASIFNYQKLVDAIKYDFTSKKDLSNSSKPLHRSCMMAWDNAARRKNNWFTYHNFSIKSLYDWVKIICEQARRDFEKEERFVFINAWNEWAEGTYLEPDQKYGYANINTVSKALFDLPFEDNLIVINNNDIVNDEFILNKKIAVQIHMFYLDTIEETIESVNKIPFDFDCYISTDTNNKAAVIDSVFSDKCKCSQLTVDVFENRGRDVLPFILQLKDRIDEYDYVYHLHSKKTIKTDHGNDWRKYIFKNLFDSSDYIKTLFHYLENDNNLGMLFPKTFPPLEYQAQWGGNLQQTEYLLSRLKIDIAPTQNPKFPVGNMFLAKTEAIRQIFKIGLSQNDFPDENGQVNSTIAHAIERCWVFLINDYGYHHEEMFNNTHILKEPSSKKRIAFYVHYNKDNVITEQDFKSLKEYKIFFDDVVYISNSLVSEKEYERLSKITNKIYLRENEGYDFGGWKFGLEQFGYKNLLKYQQIALINNSILPPLYDIKHVFADMEKTIVDFWGITLFPQLKREKFLDSKNIDEHLQSYFLVFEESVIRSGALKNFFDGLKNTNTFENAVKNGEIKLTNFMKRKGFSYAPYISESYYLSNYLNNFSLPYSKPTSLIYLGSPFIKKKAYDYMDIFEKQKLDEILNKIIKE